MFGRFLQQASSCWAWTDLKKVGLKRQDTITNVCILGAQSAWRGPDLNAAACNSTAPAAPSAGTPSSLPASAAPCEKFASLQAVVAAAAPTGTHATYRYNKQFVTAALKQ